MDLYLSTPVPPFHDAVGASFASFTARQDISPSPVPVIQPNQLRKGSRVKIEAQGEISTTGTVTMVHGVYIGTGVGASGAPSAITTVLAESAAISYATAVIWPWRLELLGLVTAVGTSGTIQVTGDVEAGTSLTAYSANAMPITAALRTVTVNTTVANAVGLCATCQTSAAGNNIKVNYFTVLLLN